jgi:hypothetical protein
VSTNKVAYDTYTALTVTNLQSLANDSTDPYGAWQSPRISNLSTLALDYEIILDLTTANTAPANDQAAYVYVCPWMTTDGGTTWIAGGNLGTTTLPTGSEGTASVSDPNSMKLAATLPYKVAQQHLNGAFSVASVLGWMPDAWSLVVRNCTGAALSTGCVVSYRAISTTNA